MLLQNMAAVTANYRRAGIRLFVLAYFVRSRSEVSGVREALGLPRRSRGEVAAGRVPSVGAIRARLHVGQPRAQRVRRYLTALVDA